MIRLAEGVLTALLVGAASGCGGYVETVGYADYPPDSYIATTEPVYFEGRPSYWYHGGWYYRDGARWGHYDREPPGLQMRRFQGPPMHRVYEGRREWHGGFHR